MFSFCISLLINQNDIHLAWFQPSFFNFLLSLINPMLPRSRIVHVSHKPRGLLLPSAADMKKIPPPTVFDLIFINYQCILPPYSIFMSPYLSSILKIRIDKQN
ncbi:hypothetical protein Hanom_Chr16g01482521 [Helianthus anomalus]